MRRTRSPAANRGSAAVTTPEIRAIPNAPARSVSSAWSVPTPPRANTGAGDFRQAEESASPPTGRHGKRMERCGALLR